MKIARMPRAIAERLLAAPSQASGSYQIGEVWPALLHKGGKCLSGLRALQPRHENAQLQVGLGNEMLGITHEFFVACSEIAGLAASLSAT